MPSLVLPTRRIRSQAVCSSILPTDGLFGHVSSLRWPTSVLPSRGYHMQMNGSIGSPILRRFHSQSRVLGVTCASEKDGNLSPELGSSSAEVGNLPEAKVSEGLLPPGWPTVGLILFGLGFLLGPPLDGIHSRVQLQVYDNWAIDILGLKTNIWVPPLLGVFYSVVGILQLALDRRFAPKGRVPQADTQKVAASFITLALLLELSAEMYKAGVPYNIEGYTLFALAELNWLLFENTWWGFALACVVGVGCPLAEIPILKVFGLWHYPQANVSVFGEGIITWVVCCYFCYTPSIGNLARWLSSSIAKGSSK